jgi:DnaJ-class molecular chaperone
MPIIVCPNCHGAGFLHARLPDRKPDYSKVIPCSMCHGKGQIETAKPVDMNKYPWSG